MSSNISYTKICAECGKKFIAKKLTTQYCSHRCGSIAYKQRVRDEKVRANNAIEIQINQPQKVLNNIPQNYFNLDEAASFMRISRSTLLRLIRGGKLSKRKIGARTVIRKEDIESFLNNL